MHVLGRGRGGRDFENVPDLVYVLGRGEGVAKIYEVRHPRIFKNIAISISN